MRRGFSVIEVVISIGIIGAVLAALGALVGTTPLLRANSDEVIALSVARSKLESVRSAGYTAATTSSWSDARLTALPSATTSLTVSTYNAKVKKVDALVSWRDAGQSTRSVTLSTLLAQTGGLP